MSFTVWVDGDSCPVAIREIVVRASRARSIDVVIVADRGLPIEKHERLTLVSVDPGKNSADSYILENLEAGDIVVTRDIELTASGAEAGAAVLDTEGKRYTRENIAERRSMHRYMSSLRAGTIDLSGCDSYDIRSKGGKRRPGGAAKKAFADALDREITARN